MSNLFSGIDGNGAEISDDGIYRYALTRQWGTGPKVSWVCFNPSTASAEIDDPSVRKMVGFSKRWGYGRMVIVNLFAVRSTDPKIVKRMGDKAVGPLNDHWIEDSAKECGEVIFAWGCAQHVSQEDISFRILAVSIAVGKAMGFTKDFPIKCLGFRKDGHPRHPLMLSYDTPREPFKLRNVS